MNIAKSIRDYRIVLAIGIGLALAACTGPLTIAVNKPLGLSPPGIEFRRAHLYAINPVGTGAMVLSLIAGGLIHAGLLGDALQPFAPMLALATAFAAAPAIALATGGKRYLAREPRTDWDRPEITCRVCEHPFEAEDMAQCPAYSGPIC